MAKTKTITLCADDFGLNKGVCQGILKLVQGQRLSAVSCMVNMPEFAVFAPELLALKHQVQIGLHFNLTEGTFLSIPNRPCFSLTELLIRTHLASIRLTLIATEFRAQLDRFVQIMGFVPDFIDGHQHIHQLPRIRQIILDLYEHQLKSHGTAIRATYPTVNNWKAKVLALTGGKALRAQLIKARIPHNKFFSGIYDFSPVTNYRTLFRNWLSLSPDGTLIMCHPGEASDQADVIAATRLTELNYFLSDEFVTDCEEYHVNGRPNIVREKNCK